MPGQDFAQISVQAEVVRPEDVRPVSATKLMLFAIAVLALTAGSFAGGYEFGYKAGEESAQSESKARLVARMEEQKKELNRLRKEAEARGPEVSTTQVGELTFYNELPKQPVEPAPLSEAAEAPQAEKTPASTATGSDMLLKQIIENELKQGAPAAASQVDATKAARPFYVQAASFIKESDARAFAAKLQAVAMPSRIERVELANLGVRHRVFVGPYATRDKADAAKASLKAKMNVSGLVVRRDR